MKLEAYKHQLEGGPASWLKRAGYAMINDRLTGQLSFSRRLTADFYPRFHIYVNEKKTVSGQEIVVLNLHLDQKRPGYEGQTRHNAEYEGEVVREEAKRLARYLLPA